MRYAEVILNVSHAYVNTLILVPTEVTWALLQNHSASNSFGLRALFPRPHTTMPSYTGSSSFTSQLSSGGLSFSSSPGPPVNPASTGDKRSLDLTDLQADPDMNPQNYRKRKKYVTHLY
jgi:hypothetical protein